MWQCSQLAKKKQNDEVVEAAAAAEEAKKSREPVGEEGKINRLFALLYKVSVNKNISTWCRASPLRINDLHFRFIA